MQALDEAVRTSLESDADSQAILDEVAQQWDSLTEELGVTTQVESYSRSLGILRME